MRCTECKVPIETWYKIPLCTPCIEVKITGMQKDVSSIRRVLEEFTTEEKMTDARFAYLVSASEELDRYTAEWRTR